MYIYDTNTETFVECYNRDFNWPKTVREKKKKIKPNTQW